jgi:hypothetical protein
MKTLKMTVIAIISIIAFSACNGLFGSSSTKAAKTQLSVQTAPAGTVAPIAPTSPAATGGSTTAATTSTIKIDTAKVLIEKVEFHGAEEDSTEFEAGPYVLDLNMDTTVSKLAVSNLPHGKYTEVSFQIHKQRPNETVIDSDFVDGPSEDQMYSVVVKGYYNGAHFVFKSPRTAEESIHLNPPLNVSDTLSSYNATIKVYVDQWFVDRNGNTLDPTDPNNMDAIEHAIQRSFRAFKDNNEDGHEDSDKTESSDTNSGTNANDGNG